MPNADAVSPPPPDTTAPSAPAAAPAAPAPPAPRPAREILPTAIAYIAVPLMVLALLDPLERGVLIALLGVPVAVVAFMRHSRARWLIVAGLVLFVLAFAYMSIAGQVAEILQRAALLPWLTAALVTVAGGIWLLRDLLAARHSRTANVIAAVLVLLAIAFTARVAVLLGDYQPWDVAMTQRITAELVTGEGPYLRLSLQTQDSPLAPEEAFWAAAVLENTGPEPVTIPPGTVLNVVLRDDAGTVVWDGAQRYYGPVPRAMPWDRPRTLAPGASTRQPWVLGCEVPGTYQITAEVTGGPFDGLATEPVSATCAARP